ncbi:MAG: GAF domain-containing protein [Alkalispirochaeta sp.]
MTSDTEEKDVISGVLDACRLLLRAPDLSEAIDTALAEIGTAAGIDRVYVFEITRDAAGTICSSQRYEWVAPQTKPEIDNPDLQNIPMIEAGYGRWIEELSAYRPVLGSISSFPPEERPTLEAQGILTLLILPIFTDGALWGFIGFDDCTRERRWSAAEVDLLVIATLALGNRLVEPARTSAEQTTQIYLELVARLLEFQKLLFSETSPGALLKRAEIRLRVLAQSYRYFSTNTTVEGVSLPEYLGELRALFRVAGAVDFQTDSFTLPIERALDAVIIIAEALATLSEHRHAELASARLTVSLRRSDDRVVITLTARSPEGVPIGNGIAPDPIALALFHALQERFDVKIETKGFDGLLFRLSFHVP